MKAARVRSDPALPDTAPGNPWRYEVFAYPDEPPPDERWSTWESQEHNPWYRVEAEMQNAFYAVSQELGRRLLLGELVGFGHLGNLAGEWRAVPPEAWRHLRVPYGTGLPGWRDGRVIGAGMEFWGVRLIDMVGLPLRAACLAYGDPRAASVMGRAATFGLQAEPSKSPKSKLDRLMEAHPSPDLRMPGQPAAEEVAAASLTLESEVLALLQSGALLAHGTFPNGQQPIAPSSWPKCRADFEHSSLQTEKDLLVRDVLVRPAIEQGAASSSEERATETSAPFPQPPDASPPRANYTPEALSAWFKVREYSWPASAPPPNEIEDRVAAELQFDGLPARDMFRGIRRHATADSWRKPGPRTRR